MTACRPRRLGPIPIVGSHGKNPLGTIVSQATHAVDPKDLFIAPAFAVQRVVEKAGWSMSSVDLFEINEAFASQMVACIRKLEVPREKVNINGGGIALGHPIGASGAHPRVVDLCDAESRSQARCRFALSWGWRSSCRRD